MVRARAGRQPLTLLCARFLRARARARALPVDDTNLVLAGGCFSVCRYTILKKKKTLPDHRVPLVAAEKRYSGFAVPTRFWPPLSCYALPLYPHRAPFPGSCSAANGLPLYIPTYPLQVLLFVVRFALGRTFRTFFLFSLDDVLRWFAAWRPSGLRTRLLVARVLNRKRKPWYVCLLCCVCVPLPRACSTYNNALIGILTITTAGKVGCMVRRAFPHVHGLRVPRTYPSPPPPPLCVVGRRFGSFCHSLTTILRP